jgi:hypothetical protein
MRSVNAARVSLVLLVVAALSVGLPAALAPHAFYDDFPFVAHWVDRLPPFNEHLVTDVGGLYLGFAVIFAWAAWKPEPTLVRAACAGWLLTQALHLGFHATHLDDFDAADAIGELISLAVLLIPAAIAIWAAQATR